MNRIWLLISIVCFGITKLSAQAGWTKAQLVEGLKTTLTDSARIDIYNELCWPIYSYTHPDSSTYFGKLAAELAIKNHDMIRLSVAHRRLGITYSNTGELRKAIFHEEKSYQLADSLHFERGKFLALNNIGVAYLNSEFLSDALVYFLRTLPYLEKEKLAGDLARVYSNCGIINRRLNNIAKEKHYFLAAEKAAQQTDDPDLQVVTNCYLCSTYRRLQQRDSAIYYLKIAAKSLDSLTSPNVSYSYYINSAQVASAELKHAEALSTLQKAKTYAGGLSDEITVLINIGEQYGYLKDFDQALKTYEIALNLSEKNKMYDNLQFVSAAMAAIYEKQKNIPAYASMIKRYVAYRDSNEKINRMQEILAKQMQFDLQRQHVADSVSFEQKEKLTNMELALVESSLGRERVMRVLLTVVLLLIIGIAIFISNRLRITRHQKQIIEDQKKLVDVRNREMTDSINYARRLQLAILPQISEIKKHLDFSIFYQPKDIIGGDFYFFDHFAGRTYLAICDCTGHGIPGAIMSVVCHEALSKSIREHKLNDPAEILTKSRELIIHSLNATEQKIRDGMDCSLLVLDQSIGKAYWAGAYNPLWIKENQGIREFKGSKQSVSYSEQLKPFESIEFNIQADTIIYLFTDGYADQFGGPKGKKYKYATLQQFVESIAHLSTAEQSRALQENFDKWKAAHEQIDDVTIATIKF